MNGHLCDVCEFMFVFFVSEIIHARETPNGIMGDVCVIFVRVLILAFLLEEQSESF